MTNRSPHRCARRWRQRLLCLSLSALALAAAAAADPKASRLYEDALQRFDKKDFAGAVLQLKNALQVDASLLPVHVLLGKSLLAQGQPIPAEAAFVEALRLGVSREEIVVPMARAALDSGKARMVLDDERFADKDLRPATRFALLVLKAGAADDVGDRRLAQQLLDRAREVDPSAPDAWVAEAKLRIRQGQLREAQAAADKALSLATAGRAAMPAYVRGTVSHVQGDLKGALSFYDQALQAEPDQVDALVSRAGLLLDLNRPADAARDVDALLKLAPNDARGQYLSALLAERNGRAADSKAALSRVTAVLDPIPIEALRYRPQLLMMGGLAHFGLNEIEKAKPYLEGVLREQPGSPAAKVLARIQLQQRDFGRAVEALDNYRRQQPRDPQAIVLLASAHIGQGRHARAISLLQAALQQEPRPEFQQALGMAYLKAGQLKPALAELEAAYRRDPKAVSTGAALGALYLQTGQPAKAVQVAEQLNKAVKDQPGLLFLLGKARLEAGDPKAARTALEGALKADPRFVDPHIELARMELQAGDVTAAERRLSAALEREPKHVGLLSLVGQVMTRQGRFDEAQRWFEKADDHSAPDDIDHGMRLVEFHLARGQVDRAREAMKRVTAKSPDAPRVLAMQARVELAGGDPRAAKATLARASAAAADEVEPLVAIAELQLAADDVAGAAHSAGKALKASPQHLGAQVLLARTDILLGNLAAAEQRVRELAQRLPKAGIGHSLLGEVAVARKQDAAAAAAFRRAYELDNDQAALLRWFGHLARSQPAEAMRVAEQWLKKHPQDLVVMRSLADAQARGRDWPAARRTYEALLKARPDDAEVLNNLANVLLAQKDAAALKTAERAHALQPNAAHIIGTLGWAAQRAGQSERALQLLRDARLRNPDSAQTRYYLGATLAAMGRNGEARAELAAAVKSNRPFDGQQDAQALLQTLN
ncbi:MAG: PEP-CTERM system TPR-repeat protein PrsT [Proteobacteria bacterium]|nr:PEP-CTERM system TPR-repeat protein PrsT [Pseudomonadota bacterium]